MAGSGDVRKAAFVERTRTELARLAGKGCVMSGNAFSPVLLVKGDLSQAEKGEGSRLLAGPDGDALRAALARLGYAPEEWCALSVLDDAGEPLAPELLRLAVATLDPATLVLLDETAAAAAREAYANELAVLEDLDEAMLEPGTCARVLGMRVMNLGGFAAALGDDHAKQLMWARLKQLGPLGEPY